MGIRLVYVLALIGLWTFTGTAVSQQPPNASFTSFASAKKKARDEVYRDHKETFYCGCRYVHASNSGGLIDHSACQYQVRKNDNRARRLEWEHVMPAHRFGRQRPCWRNGHHLCVNSKGPFSGRACCAKKHVDPQFRTMENDLHNLVPAVGEVNGDRSNHPFDIVPGEVRLYGACDFELTPNQPKLAEAREDRRGDIARTYFYMAETYGIALTAIERNRFENWHQLDPPSDWERTRNARIQAIQHNINEFVTGVDN